MSTRPIRAVAAVALLCLAAFPASPAPKPDPWVVTGNAGTTAGTDFVGTTDSQPLEIKVNAARALRIEPGTIDSPLEASPNMIGGYHGNTVSGFAAGCTIAGGGNLGIINSTTAGYATVSGGLGNTASGFYSAVGGGVNNTASGNGAVVSGGEFNTASGNSSTVPGGQFNTAAGVWSFAAGRHATAGFQGSFVWADSQPFTLFAQGPDSFWVRATGGTVFVSGVDGTGTPTAGVYLPPGGTGWSSVSDRNLKANFAAVDGRDILQRIAAMPVQTWNMKSQKSSIRHIGPMAQDFSAAFGVGEDDKHISSVDADGVAFASIQGLYKVVQDSEAKIASLETRNTGQQKQISDLRKRVNDLEKLVQSLVKAR